MKKVNEILSKNLPLKSSVQPAVMPVLNSRTIHANHSQITSSNSTNQEAIDKRIDTLFSRFAAIYGQIWSNNFKDERALLRARQEWSDALKSFDNQTLKEALLNCRENCKFPPSLPEFIAGCKAKIARHIPTLQSVSTQPCKPEIAQKYLAQMKAVLNRHTTKGE